MNSNFYVPINYTNLSETVPDGDDILYSTLCAVQVLQRFARVHTYIAHILLTKHGFAMTSSLRDKDLVLTYIPWHDSYVWKEVDFKPENMTMKGEDYNYMYYPVRDTQYEALESYQARSRDFGFFIRDFWVNATSGSYQEEPDTRFTYHQKTLPAVINYPITNVDYYIPPRPTIPQAPRGGIVDRGKYNTGIALLVIGIVVLVAAGLSWVIFIPILSSTFWGEFAGIALIITGAVLMKKGRY